MALNGTFLEIPTSRPVTEEDIVDLLQGHVVELVQEGLLDVDQLGSKAGFLIA